MERKIRGRYRLLKKIGTGSMGAVWQAEDLRLKRPVAIKLMEPDLSHDIQAKQRFEREAIAVARLSSPYVVQIYDFGIDGDDLFMVMELLAGTNLKVWFTAQKPLPVDEVARLVDQIGKALGSAHELGIVHRDLKPANVQVVPIYGVPTAKVLDFGIIKALAGFGDERRLTEEGALVGTPRYMSPEQVMSEKVDARADLWALAIVAFKLLTDEHPFKGNDLAGFVFSILNDRPRKATALRPELPPAVDAFFNRALTRNPDKRFQTANEFTGAFQRYAISSRAQAPTVALTHRDEAFGSKKSSSSSTPHRRKPAGTEKLTQHHLAEGSKQSPEPKLEGNADGATVGLESSNPRDPERRTSRPQKLLAFGVAGVVVAGALGAWALKGSKGTENDGTAKTVTTQIASAANDAVQAKPVGADKEPQKSRSTTIRKDALKAAGRRTSRPGSSNSESDAQVLVDASVSPANSPGGPVSAPGGDVVEPWDESTRASRVDEKQTIPTVPSAGATASQTTEAPFNAAGARSALAAAAGRAAGCSSPDGPTGRGTVAVTFAPSGNVTQAVVGAPFGGTTVGSCVAVAFRAVSVPPFSGSHTTVHTSFFIK